MKTTNSKSTNSNPQLDELCRCQVLTVRDAVTRAKYEGYPISEYSLRCWIKQELIPARFVGRKIYVDYSKIPEFLTFGRVSPSAM